MLVPARLLCPTDVGWLIDQVTVDCEPLTLTTTYGLHPRRNDRQDVVVNAARAEALWRGCRVHIGGGGRRWRLAIGCRENTVLHIEPPTTGPDGAGVLVPRRPWPSSPNRSRHLRPPRQPD